MRRDSKPRRSRDFQVHQLARSHGIGDKSSSPVNTRAHREMPGDVFFLFPPLMREQEQHQIAHTGGCGAVRCGGGCREGPLAPATRPERPRQKPRQEDTRGRRSWRRGASIPPGLTRERMSHWPDPKPPSLAGTSSLHFLASKEGWKMT